jgi:hypothetical protein
MLVQQGYTQVPAQAQFTQPPPSSVRLHYF